VYTLLHDRVRACAEDLACLISTRLDNRTILRGAGHVETVEWIVWKGREKDPNPAESIVISGNTKRMLSGKESVVGGVKIPPAIWAIETREYTTTPANILIPFSRIRIWESLL
jgi:hypothetical protein